MIDGIVVEIEVFPCHNRRQRRAYQMNETLEGTIYHISLLDV